MKHVLATISIACLGLPLQAQVRPTPPGQPQPAPVGRVVTTLPATRTTEGNSHRPLPEERQLEDFRHWLEGRGHKSPPKDIDPELLKKLMERLPKGQENDPGRMEEMLRNHPEFRNPAFLKQLQELMKGENFPNNILDQLPKTDLGKERINDADLGDRLKKLIESGTQKNEGDPLQNPLDIGKDLGKGALDKLPDAKSPYADNDWVKWLDKNFKDSPAAKDAMKDLMFALENQGGKGMFDGFPDLKDSGFGDLGGFGSQKSGNSWNIKPPDWDLNPSKAGSVGSGGGSNSWGGGSSGGSGSSWGGGGGGLGEGAGVLLGILAAAGLLVLALVMFRNWKRNRVQTENTAGGTPSPFDFDSIRTREELVRAFDRVSLDRCGEDARNWNHRVIASQIIESQPALVEPAEEIANLYERARYAPRDEDLTPGEFSSARQDLRTLAGAGS